MRLWADLRPIPPKAHGLYATNGLAALKAGLEFESASQAYELQRRDWVKNVRRAELKLGSPGTAVSSAFGRVEISSLLRACDRQRIRRGGAFADPLARHGLMFATVLALLNFEFWAESGAVRKLASKSDWDSAWKAVDALFKVFRRGTPVGAAAIRQGVHGLSMESLSGLRAAIATERDLARKPHSDALSAQRLACREFAKHVYLSFGGEVPVSWVEEFGKLIGYRSEKLQRTYVKQWIEEFARVIGPPISTATFARKIRKSGR